MPSPAPLWHNRSPNHDRNTEPTNNDFATKAVLAVINKDHYDSARAIRQADQVLHQRECEIYHQAYLEITRAVEQVADRQGIDIVIRKTAHQPAPDPDPSQPQSVANSMNHPTLLNTLPSTDLTEAVLEVLNQGTRTAERPRP